MTASNHVFSAFSFMSFILTSIPFAWHFEAWNTGTCIYMAWTAIGSLLFFVNSVVWDGNAINWAPVYCDIFTKLFIGLTVAIPAASLTINRRLYYIIRMSSVTRTATERRKNMFTDLAIGVGIPVVVMILHVVVQGHRFDILEDIGCWPATYNTYLTYVLVHGPALGVSLVGLVYAILNVITLRKNYIECKELLSSSSTRCLTTSRYLRLMCLGSVEILADVPLNLYMIIMSTKAGVQPWISWEDTHSGFSRVDQIPGLIWRSAPSAAALEWTRWSIVLCGFIFFAFFGFADEARRNYRLAYNTIASKLGWRLASAPGINSNGNNNFGPYQSGGAKRLDGPFGINGAESWFSSINAFAGKVKLTVLRSSGSVSFAGKSTTGGGVEQLGTINGLPVYVTKDMIQKRDADSASVFTTLSDMTAWTSSSAASLNLEHQYAIPEALRPPCIAGSSEERQEPAYKSNAPGRISPSLPTPPPTSSSHPQPRPTSVPPAHNGSFLDLSTSEQEMSPPGQDSHLAENRV